MTVTFNHSHKDPTAMRLLIARFVQFVLFKLAVNVVCSGCGKHHTLPMEDEIFDLETMQCFDCAEHAAFINEAYNAEPSTCPICGPQGLSYCACDYDANCEERSWGEDCDSQREPLPFSVKCGAGCGRDIHSDRALPVTTLCWACEQDIPF